MTNISLMNSDTVTKNAVMSFRYSSLDETIHILLVLSVVKGMLYEFK